MSTQNQPTAKPSWLSKTIDKGMEIWKYVSVGVWHDQRNVWYVNTLKTLNLSLKSFFNSDIQTQACAMTYRTLLAIVPALALLFAIAGGFGFKNTLQAELFDIFPAQKTAISYALGFIDSYLSSYSEGLFVGVGAVFLLWTLISLLGNIEDTFNLIWGLKEGRSFGRKIVDYTAMLMILPIVMLCASGLSLLLSSTLQTWFHWNFMSPFIKIILEGLSWVLTWLFFGLLYLLMPNTKVKFANAFMAGVFAGTGFLVLQWLFITGQLYVARYNAIYGSFSFLPLMLLWTQLTWVIIFAGGVVCYSSQNIYMYNFNDAIENMSSRYYSHLILAICAVVVQRFLADEGATSPAHLVKDYKLPPRLGSMVCDKLVAAGILSIVLIDSKHNTRGYLPALSPDKITVAEIYNRLDSIGSSDFIPDFDENFPGVISAFADILENEEKATSKILVSELKIKHITNK